MRLICGLEVSTMSSQKPKEKRNANNKERTNKAENGYKYRDKCIDERVYDLNATLNKCFNCSFKGVFKKLQIYM